MLRDRLAPAGEPARAAGGPPEQASGSGAAAQPGDSGPVLTPAALRPVALIIGGRELEFAWLALWVACLVAIARYPQYQVIPFDVIWLTLVILYAIRLWPPPRLLASLACVAAGTAATVGDNVIRHFAARDALDQMPVLAAFFLTVFWLVHRREVIRERAELDAEAERLLASQRQFLQDASHQLRTPITIALGYAELLAGELAERQLRDIDVVVGELERLKALSERLLLVAASENPEFLALEPVRLDELAVDLLRRWAPTGGGRLKAGRLDPVVTLADTERLSLALDALVENAVRHTRADGTITVSVVRQERTDRQETANFALIVVEDDGEGIAEADLPHIFARFRTTGPRGGEHRGTGLGLALVQAIARGHGGEALATSTLGAGSRFEISIQASSPVTEQGRSGASNR